MSSLSTLTDYMRALTKAERERDTLQAELAAVVTHTREMAELNRRTGNYERAAALFAMLDEFETNLPAAARALLDELAWVKALVKDYEECAEDKRRLCREIDEILCGKEGMAKQASLCDLVGPIADLKAHTIALREALEELLRMCSPVEGESGHSWNVAIQQAHAALRQGEGEK